MVKKITQDTMNQASLVQFMYGTVTSTSPLEINIEQRLTLQEDFLFLTNNVIDHEVYMTTENEIGNETKKLYKVHHGLIVGDQVMLMRMQGGQQYIVLNKLVKP